MTPLDHGQIGQERGEAVDGAKTIDKQSMVENRAKNRHDYPKAINEGEKAGDKTSPKLASDASSYKRKKRARYWRTKNPKNLANNSHNQNLSNTQPENAALQPIAKSNEQTHSEAALTQAHFFTSENLYLSTGDIKASITGSHTGSEGENVKKRRRKKRKKKNSLAEIAGNINPNKANLPPALLKSEFLPPAFSKAPPFTATAMQHLPPHAKPIHHKNLMHNSATPLYAALDLGTNNCRLLIATPTKPGHFRVIDAFSRIVRLGEGLTSTGRLNDKAIERAIEALKICANKLRHKNITRQRFIATEACRSAINGSDFIQRVFDETGLQLEIVDRETEARLAVSGCGTLVERNTNAIVLFDIGGGSSEIALIDMSKQRSPRLAEHITAWTSLPVGVVTLAERFGGENVSAKDFALMKNHVSGLLRNFAERHKLGELTKSPHFHLMGTSGTVTTLAGIHLDLERYDRRQIDGIWMNNSDVSKMTEKLLSMDMAERVANPCIGQDRADLVLAGCAILEAIREVWPSERLRVADRGLREGILTELMSRDGAWRRKKIRLSQRLYGKGTKPQKHKS